MDRGEERVRRDVRMKAIICCACGAVPGYCKRSFKILFPNEPVPPLYIKSKAKELLEALPKTSEAYAQIDMVVKKRGRYGNYIEYDEDGAVIDYWNLLKSRRIV